MTEPILLKRQEINDHAWNSLLTKSVYQSPYAYTGYLDCVSPNWQALVWPSTTQYKIILPLPIKKKWGITVIQQPLFCQFLGFFSEKDLEVEQVLSFLKVLHRHFRYISLYAFHPLQTNLLATILPSYPFTQVGLFSTHWLSLNQSYDDIYQNYKPDRRKNLTRAVRWDWHSEVSEDIEPLIALFEQNHAEKLPSGVHPEAYHILRTLSEYLLSNGIGRLLYVRKNGEVCAGILLIETATCGIYIFNAADNSGRKGNARSYLLNEYFKEKENLNLIFDFETPEIENIANFYESFGAKKMEYLTLKKNNLPFPFRQIQELRKWIISE
ncbi:GNAT family N-acetyltransferase [Arundinibacter roseus]|uniref:GNAT family N-acetyltransferase n=1 Tax=Arundinibacter roseus TaxID=2070510 RepID=UPI001404BBC8|nr:GNAT family N-acetyltransferase [Arundinibacter roseus]